MRGKWGKSQARVRAYDYDALERACDTLHEGDLGASVRRAFAHDKLTMFGFDYAMTEEKMIKQIGAGMWSVLDPAPMPPTSTTLRGEHVSGEPIALFYEGVEEP